MKVFRFFLIILILSQGLFTSFAQAQFLCELKDVQSNKTLSHFKITDESSGQSVQVANYWAGIYIEYQIAYLRLEDDLQNIADHEYHGDFQPQLNYEVQLKNSNNSQKITFHCIYRAQ